MDIITTIIAIILALVIIGWLIKIAINAFAFIFALVVSWILVPQENRAAFFADLCDKIYKKK
jgi:hypothetical protein